MNYQFENLDPGRFQELCQSLLLKEHPHTQCFPISQSDGGRDAIAYYQLDKNEKEFIVFQIKQVKSQPDLHKWVDEIVKKETPKVNKLIPKGAKMYYLITNVQGSAHLDTGSIDQVNQILKDAIQIPTICWWRDDLSRRLDSAWDLKWAYPEILTGLDMLRLILEGGLTSENGRLISVIKTFVQSQYDKDEVVRFKQGGLIQSNLIDLFIDVPIEISNPQENRRLSHTFHRMVQSHRYIEAEDSSLFEHSAIHSDTQYYHVREEQSLLGAARMLLDPILQEQIPHIVLEGAPGQGKSTIVQYICQMYRMCILDKSFVKVPNHHKPTSLRIPIKIDLRDFATWLNGQDPFSSAEGKNKPEGWHKSLESFLAYQIKYDSGGASFSVTDLQAIARISSLLIVLDGFDEVADIPKREEIVAEVTACTKRLGAITASLQVMITSRPAAFANSPGFPEKLFPHFELISLTIPQINDYAAKWVKAQKLDSRDANDVKQILKEKLDQPHLRDLARNPMQLAILLTLIHLRGPSLPEQRTALYDSYVERFFDREADKSAIVRQNRAVLLNIHSYLAWILHSESEQGKDRGSVSVERLRNLIRDYLNREELEIELAEKLSVSTVERIFFLVSRVQGTFEFEVQPLREYFAARYLYKTAPHPPPGVVRHGTILDRFEALAKNFYWSNVTRFYAGFYNEGELPSLVYQLQDLAQRDGYRDISYPKVLSATLLSDSIFAQHRRAMKDVLSIVVEKLGLRYFTGRVIRYPNAGVPLVLPKDGGRSELVKYCINELHSSYANDYITLFTNLIKANSHPSEIKELWLKEVLATVGIERTKWLLYGFQLEILPHLSTEDIEQLLSDDPENSQRIMLLFRVLPIERIQKLDQRYKIFIGALMSSDTISPLRSKSKSILDSFCQALDLHKFGLAFRNSEPISLSEAWKHRDIALVPLDKIVTDPNLPTEEAIKMREILKIVQVEQEKTVKEWISELTSWDIIVENCRIFWGEQWLYFLFANVASGIKSNTETYKDFSDLFDHSKSLCKRTRYARLRAGSTDWWKSQLESATDEQERMFALLVLLTWGSPNTIMNLAELIDSNLNLLSIDNWHRLFRSLNQSVSTVSMHIEGRNLPFYAEKLPTSLSLKTVTVFGTLAQAEASLEIYHKHLLTYRGKDSSILQFCLSMALESAINNQSYWQESLAMITHCYAHGLFFGRQQIHYRFQTKEEAIAIPNDIAEEIAQHPERYPHDLAMLIEPIFKKIVDSNITPVGNIAKEQGWFEDVKYPI